MNPLFFGSDTNGRKRGERGDAGMAPYFSLPPEGDSPKRRLLLLSYHFPPCRTVGAIRWQKFARYVAERGYGLDVITRDPAFVGEQDPARLRDLPAGTRVYGIPPIAPLAVEHLEHLAWLVYVRLPRLRRRRAVPGAGEAATQPTLTEVRTDFLPREEVLESRFGLRYLLRSHRARLQYVRERRWADAALEAALTVLDPAIHQAVVTSGPPHMVHDAGRRVSEQSGLPFVMDMRDPWSRVQRVPEAVASPVWLRLAAEYEGRAVAQASLVAANTEVARAAMAEHYPEARDRIITVMNGSDDTEPLPAIQASSRFTISFAGTIYLDLGLRALFRAAARVVRELELTPDEFGIEMIGSFFDGEGVPVHVLAAEEGVEAYVTLGPPRGHREALEFLTRGTMLISIPGPNDRLAIPAKIFELARFPAWILAFSAAGSATELLLRGTDAEVVDVEDTETTVRILRQRITQFQRSGRPRPLAEHIDLSRRGQAMILMDAIERVTGAGVGAPEEMLPRQKLPHPSPS